MVAYLSLTDCQNWETPGAREWRLAVQRVFKEENVTYRIDSEGGVHFYVDEEFAVSNAATIAALQPDRYANARHAFESRQASLRKVPPDGKGAVRGWIDAAHFYRHEQGMPDKIAQPPLQLAILLSTGPAHLRWSAELDAQCAIAEAVTAK
jgi:hypothetical protein